MWVFNEVTFDRFQKNYKNIYLVASEWKYADGKSDFIMETPTPLSPYIKDNFPEVAQSTRFAKQFGGRFLKSGEKKFLEQGLAIEPSFFDIFTVDFKSGSPKIFQENPNSIIISQRLADKFFGNQDPVNQTITFFVNPETTELYKICGVYKNIPDNSSIQFDFLIPVTINPDDNWFAFGYSTFVLLPNTIDKTQLNEKIKIGIRIAAEEEPKFEFYTSRLGIGYKNILPFYRSQIKDNKKVKLKMLHFFINTGIRDNAYYWNELAKCLKVYTSLKRICPSLDSLNIGGGFPIKNSLAFDFDYEYMVDEIINQIQLVCEEEEVEVPNIFTEFGSFTVGESGGAVYEVLYQKQFFPCLRKLANHPNAKNILAQLPNKGCN